MVLEPGSGKHRSFVVELMSLLKAAFRKEHYDCVERRFLYRFEEIEREKDEMEVENKEVKLKLSRAEGELKHLKAENEQLMLKLIGAEVCVDKWRKRFNALEPRVLQIEEETRVMSKKLWMSQGEALMEKETNSDGQVLPTVNAPSSVENAVGKKGQPLQARAGDCPVDLTLVKEEIESDSGMRFERTSMERQTSSDQINQKFCFLTPLKRKPDMCTALKEPSMGPSSLIPSKEKKRNEQNLAIRSSDYCMYGSDSTDSSDSEDSEDSLTDFHKSGSNTKLCFSRLQMNRGCWSWESEEDMCYVFSKYPEKSMEALCALYRHCITADQKTDHGPSNLDKLRVSSLAEFLIDGDPYFKLKKSVKEFEEYDGKGIDECRQLALRYSSLLFDIYRTKQDPFFTH